MVELQELKQRLADAYDPDELVDLLDLSSEDIIEKFEDRVADMHDYLVEDAAVGDPEDGIEEDEEPPPF